MLSSDTLRGHEELFVSVVGVHCGRKKEKGSSVTTLYKELVTFTWRNSSWSRILTGESLHWRHSGTQDYTTCRIKFVPRACLKVSLLLNAHLSLAYTTQSVWIPSPNSSIDMPLDSSSTKLSYLPTAHTSRGRTNDYDTPASDSAAVINTQPAPAASMNTNGSKDDQNRAMRLRGGCIPCPVSTKRSLSKETESLTKFQDGGCCYIIPIPCCCWGDFLHPTHPLAQQLTMLYPIHW